MKIVARQNEWSRVSSELAGEKAKLESYDNTLIRELNNVVGKRILDYGAGPGILASALQRIGCQVKAFDVSSEMRRQCAERIGYGNVFETVEELPSSHFDVAVCNLVVCIVDEDEVARISSNLVDCLNEKGIAYVGFCNPLIFDVPESALNIRTPSGDAYHENHSYKKIKKEGSYEIVEAHRPIEWYFKTFQNVGLAVQALLFTPEYSFNGRKLNDFVVFKLSKSGGKNV